MTIQGSFEPIDGHGHFTTEMKQVVPEFEGLEIELLPGAVPAVFVRNLTDRVLTVPGGEGEPFLKITSGGVHANLRSPTYYLAGAQTIRRVPPQAQADAPPRWKKVSDAPLWAWLEYRARLPEDLEQRALLGDRPRVVLEWTTPMRLGHETLEITGLVRWIPPAGSSQTERTTSQWSYLLAGAAVLAPVGLLLARHRILTRRHDTDDRPTRS